MRARTVLLRLLPLLGLTLQPLAAFAVNTLDLPVFDGVAADASDPFAFIKTVVISGMGLMIGFLVVGAFLGYGGGLIAKLNQARQKGDWGSLGVYLGSGLLVVIIIALMGYMGGQVLSDFE